MQEPLKLVAGARRTQLCPRRAQARPEAGASLGACLCLSFRVVRGRRGLRRARSACARWGTAVPPALLRDGRRPTFNSF
jgi:hypothetical protein